MATTLKDVAGTPRRATDGANEAAAEEFGVQRSG